MSDQLLAVNRNATFNARRALGALALLVVWFTVSNTCGLALIEGKRHFARTAAVLHGCCPSGEEGPQNQPAAPVKVCCKSLHAVPIAAGSKLLPIESAGALCVLASRLFSEMEALERGGDGVLNGTGPPELRSFAEVVLQRSLQIHAPPVVA
jgi:hypothetical protein